MFIMKPFNQEKNLELIKKYQETKCEEAFNELYVSNYGLIDKVMGDTQGLKLLDSSERFSLCMNGFMKSAKLYNPTKEITMAYYFINNMQREIKKGLAYFRYKDRLKHFGTSLSLNYQGDGKEGADLEVIERIGGKCDNYFDNEFLNTKDELQYALDRVKKELKPYIIELASGELNMAEIGRELGLSRQVISYQVKTFKENFKKYYYGEAM